MSASLLLTEQTIDQAKKLVNSLESGQEDQAQEIMDDLAKLREGELFQELGKLTRELHDTLSGFRLDSKLSDLAEQEIPDAKERLNHVIDMTEQAAHKTLNAVEEALPVAEDLSQSSDDILQQWTRFRNRELSADEFRNLAGKLDTFLPEVVSSSEKLRTNISDVLMAQDFQDLTGQVIRRVINLVHDVEESLVDLIRLSGAGVAGDNAKTKETQKVSSIEAEGPQVLNTDADDPNIMNNQDDVDDLLSSLGF